MCTDQYYPLYLDKCRIRSRESYTHYTFVPRDLETCDLEFQFKNNVKTSRVSFLQPNIFWFLLMKVDDCTSNNYGGEELNFTFKTYVHPAQAIITIPIIRKGDGASA